MAVPTNHLSNLPRDAEVQKMVESMVRYFLPPQAIEMLAHILEVPSGEIQYNYNEGMKIASRPDVAFVQGMGTRSGLDSVGFPLLQLYDYIFTIDRVIDQVKGLRRQVSNLGALRSTANLEILRQQILSHDYTPWELRDAESVQALMTSTDAETKSRTAGMRLGPPHVYHDSEMDGYTHVPMMSTARLVREMLMDARKESLGKDVDDRMTAIIGPRSRIIENDAKSEDDKDRYELKYGLKANGEKWAKKMGGAEVYRRLLAYAREVGDVDSRHLRKKNSYEQSVDEAALLRFNTLNAIVALSQGLFQVDLVQANKLQAPTVRDLASSARNDPSSTLRPDDHWKILTVSTTNGERVPRLLSTSSEAMPIHLSTGSIAAREDDMSEAGKTLARQLTGAHVEPPAVSDIRIPRKSWVNAFANTSVGLNMGVSLLQPKVTDITQYPANWIGRVYMREVKDAERARALFGYRGPVQGHRLPPQGGAIARTFFAIPARFGLLNGEKLVIDAFTRGTVRNVGAWWGILNFMSREGASGGDVQVGEVSERSLTPLEVYPKQWDDGFYSVLDEAGRRSLGAKLQDSGFEHTLMRLSGPWGKPSGITYTNVGALYLSEDVNADKYGRVVTADDGATKNTLAFVSAPNDTADPVPNPGMSQIDLSDPTTPPTRAMRVSQKMIYDEMERMREHPISACPGLANAFQDAKIHTYLLSLYGELQREFASALARADIDVQTTDARQLVNARGRGRGLGSGVKCGPNQIPVFRDSENRVLPWEEAVWTHPETGQEFLNPRVDVNNSTCTDLVPAPAGIPKIAQLPTVARIRRMMKLAEANAGAAARTVGGRDSDSDGDGDDGSDEGF